MDISNRIFRILLRTVLMFFLLVHFNFLNAQDSALKFDHLTIEDGLSQSSVFSILEDDNGFMWFGTRSGGLNRYDGYTFTVYKHDGDNPQSISGNEVISLFEDSRGNIWVGTRNDGLNCFNIDTEDFKRYYFDENDSTSIPDNTINCISEDINGTLWIGTNFGLCAYDRENNSFIRYGENKNLGAVDIRALVWSHNGLLWIGGKNGLYLYDTKNSVQLKHFEHDAKNTTSLSGSHITSIVEDRKGRLWVGTYNKGLNRLDNHSKGVFIRYMNNPANDTSIASNIVRTVHEDRKGVIWIGTSSSLDQLVPEQQGHPSPVFIHIRNNESNDQSLSQNSIYSFFEDSHGNYWIGNYNMGVNYLYHGGEKFEFHKHQIYNENSLSNSVVSSFAVNNDGIWIGTEGGGLNLFNKSTGKFTHFRKDLKNPYSLSSDFIKSVFVDQDNDLWVGTNNGLNFYDRNENKFIIYLKGSYVYSIEGGVDKEIWIGTTNGVSKLNKWDKSIKYYQYLKSNSTTISAENIHVIYKDKNDGIWIGTKTGLNYYDKINDNFIQYHNDKNIRTSLSHSNVTSICEDFEGYLWVGTIDGLNKFDPNSKIFTRFSEKDGLPNNVITNIRTDDEGYLWVSSNNYLTKINPNVTTGSGSKRRETDTFIQRNYDVGDGLQCVEFRQNASLKSRSGVLFFGGVNGFVLFHPDSVKNNTIIPRVVITDFKLFNKPVEVGTIHSPLEKQMWQTTELTLNHKQSVITFGFVSLNYTSPQKNKFAYRMEGFDKDWNYIGNKREATYTNLPAGKYVFRVKASNNDGIWNEQGTSVELTILPPWWETWIFRIFITLMLIVSGFGFYYYRVNELKRQQRILEKKVIERTFELKEVNAELEEKQKRILQQQEELQQQKKLLEEMNASKDKFFSILAHDLKNPFGSMLGFLELLNSNYNDFSEKERFEMVRIAIESAQLISNLIDNLLHWSRSQRGLMPFHAENINLKVLVDEEVSLLSTMLSKKDIELRLDYKKRDIDIIADRNMLSMVVRNLVSNAIKFTKQGGRIGIKICDVSNGTLFEISDTGIGIPENVIGRLFRPDLNFNREGTENERGTGLGLMLCKEFVEIHKGKIWVKSEVGFGTTFYFTIPVD